MKPMTRIEALSDGVFAISATLLVVSLEVPDSLPALRESLGGFVAFAFSFAMLMMIWVEHNHYFRVVGTEDALAVALNSVLLFVVLFYVYPLKFMSLSLAHWLFGIGPPRISGWQDLQSMFLIYGIGWTAVFLALTALYLHGSRSATLDAAARLEGRIATVRNFILALAGVASVALAASRLGLRWGAPGAVFGLIGPALYLHGAWADRRRARAAPLSAS